jgi:hypothetical protein
MMQLSTPPTSRTACVGHRGLSEFIHYAIPEISIVQACTSMDTLDGSSAG